MKILVTGGAGFIGSHLVDRLRETKPEIVVLDNLSSGFLSNLSTLSDVRFVEGSVLDFELLEGVSRGVEQIYHLAEFIPNSQQYGPGHVIKYSNLSPLSQFETCVRGTLNVLEAARRAGSSVCFTSTAALYGNSGEHVTCPASFYGTSKAAAELYCTFYQRNYSVPVTIARLFNVYGPRQRKYILYDLLTKIYGSDSEVNLLGTGNETRDFVYVTDAVDALLHLTGRDAENHVFDVGTGKGMAISTFARRVMELTGCDKEIRFTGSSWIGDVHELVATPLRLLDTGYAFRTDLSDGLRKTISWFVTDELARQGFDS